MSRERRLGRGLEALLGQLSDAPAGSSQQTGASQQAGTPQPSAAGTTAAAANSAPATISPANAIPNTNGLAAVASIDKNPFQPRETFEEEEIAALAASLKSHGLLQPLVVRRKGDRFQLVAGERRLRAAAKAGWINVPVRIVEADDRQMAELAIVENIQRKDLNPLEKGRSFQRYIDAYRCTLDELASRLKVDRSTVSNFVRLLELPASIQSALSANQITQGHARTILALTDENEQLNVCRKIQSERLSVRQTEELVQAIVHGDAPAPSAPAASTAPAAAGSPAAKSSVPPGRPPHRGARTRSPQIASLEKEFRGALGTRVEIREGVAGRGKIMIHFRDHAEFDRIREFLLGPEKPKRKAG